MCMKFCAGQWKTFLMHCHNRKFRHRWWVGGGERLGKVIWGGQEAQPPTPYMGQGGGRAVTFVVIPSKAIEDNKAGIIGKIW